jgi:hypothetical protein
MRWLRRFGEPGWRVRRQGGNSATERCAAILTCVAVTDGPQLFPCFSCCHGLGRAPYVVCVGLCHAVFWGYTVNTEWRRVNLMIDGLIPITDEQAKLGQEIVKAFRELARFSAGRWAAPPRI